MNDLGLTYNAMWRGTTELVELGVLLEAPGTTAPNVRAYRVDIERLAFLHDGLRRYTMGKKAD